MSSYKTKQAKLLKRLKGEVANWNQWRKSNRILSGLAFPAIDLTGKRLTGINLTNVNLTNALLLHAQLDHANLSGANLTGANLTGSSLRDANLSNVCLQKAVLKKSILDDADISKSDLSGASLHSANLNRTGLSTAILIGADLRAANLSMADLRDTSMSGADFRGAIVRHANLRGANLRAANFAGANLTGADLQETDLRGTNFDRAILKHALLNYALLVETNLENADLSKSMVYGISAWALKLRGADQSDLVITRPDEPTITLDNLEVAQFIHLLLNNARIRHVIDEITSKVVLILGRFTPERLKILDAIRAELRDLNRLPILFDFEKPSTRDTTETIVTLAGMARFIIADITDARSIPQELMAIVPHFPSVPVKPLLLASQQEYGMFDHFHSFPWVLDTFLYENQEALLRSLKQEVISPAEAKALELRRKQHRGECP